MRAASQPALNKTLRQNAPRCFAVLLPAKTGRRCKAVGCIVGSAAPARPKQAAPVSHIGENRISFHSWPRNVVSAAAPRPYEGDGSGDLPEGQRHALPVPPGGDWQSQFAEPAIIGSLDFLVREEEAMQQAGPRAAAAAAKHLPPTWVTVRHLTGSVLTIELPVGATVNNLKQLINERTGALPEQQRLIHGSKFLQEDVPLSQLGIQTGDQLMMVMRLRGGRCHLRKE